MSADESVAGDIEKVGVSRVVERKYRNRVYRPARYYLTWYFLASVLGMVAFIFLALDSYLYGGLEGFERDLPWTAGGFVSNMFLAILSTYFGMVGSSLHLHLGDKGIYSLGSVPATLPVVTPSTFLCVTPEQRALYDKRYHGARITRYYVHRWGRKGGCQNWPGKAGGKSEGFWTWVQYSWEVAEITDDHGKVTTEPILWQPCPTCNRDRVRSNDSGEKHLGFVQVPPLTAADLARMAQDIPGIKTGGVIELPGQVIANRYVDELPWELMEAIRGDEEFRASSRVDCIWDRSAESGLTGVALPHNAAIELFGLHFTSKMMRAQAVSYNQTIAQINQLRGGNIGGGPGP